MNEPQPSADYANPRFTYGDYLLWADGERWELIDGEAYCMAPAPTVHHQRLVGNVFAQLHAQLQGARCEAFIAPFDVRLPHADEPDEQITNVVQPDLMIVCDPSKIDDRGCRGAPDFVVEVLSPSTMARDRFNKRDLYERHDVREYWLIHPTERVVTIHRRTEDGRFGPPIVQSAEGRLALTSVPDVHVDWAQAFARAVPPG
ncbi:MAG: Uma2 family endonuclease [Myxococcota bacterium]